MKRLVWASLVLLSASAALLALQAALLLREATARLHAAPAALQRELQIAREELLAEVDEQAAGVRRDLAAQLTAARRQAEAELTAARVGTLAEVRAAREAADRRVGDTLSRVDVALGQTGPVLAQAAQAFEGVPPVLASANAATANAAALTKDVQESLDDSYWDAKALLGSADVAARGIAETAGAVAKGAPQVVQSAQTTAAAVAREADAMTKPQRWWQKLLGPVYTVGRLVAAFL